MTTKQFFVAAFEPDADAAWGPYYFSYANVTFKANNKEVTVENVSGFKGNFGEGIAVVPSPKTGALFLAASDGWIREQFGSIPYYMEVSLKAKEMNASIWTTLETVEVFNNHWFNYTTTSSSNCVPDKVAEQVMYAREYNSGYPSEFDDGEPSVRRAVFEIEQTLYTLTVNYAPSGATVSVRNSSGQLM